MPQTNFGNVPNQLVRYNVGANNSLTLGNYMGDVHRRGYWNAGTWTTEMFFLGS